MPKPPITKKNPVSVLPEKNRKIFTHVIPTLRKIQEKKYFAELYRERQKKKTQEYYVNRIISKLNNFFEERHQRSATTKTKKEQPLRVQSLTKKNQREIRNFILERLKVLDLNQVESSLLSDLERIKIETRSFIRKTNKTEKEFSKESAIKKLIDDIDYYDYLHPSQRQKILDLINYQLSLLTKEKKITDTQFEDLKKEVFELISKKIDPNEAIEKKAKKELTNEIMSSDLIKRELNGATILEKQEILSKLNSLILENFGTKKGNAYDILREYIARKYK